MSTMKLRALVVVAKFAFFLLALGSLGMALLAKEAGPWVFGVFPAAVAFGTITIAVSRSMKLRAAMRAVDEEQDDTLPTSPAVDRNER